MRTLWSAVFTAVVLSYAVPLFAEDNGPYLFEQLENSTYLSTFKALFHGQSNLEPWLKGYIDERNGVDTPGSQLVVNGQTFEVYQVCQPHNCPGNVLYVLYVPGGSRAFALFTKDDGISRYFGSPDDSLQKVLQDLTR